MLQQEGHFPEGPKNNLKKLNFHFQDIICIQNESLAMGARTSSITSEIYPQYIENTKIFQILVEHEIEGYFGHVDNNLFMHKQDQTNIHGSA